MPAINWKLPFSPRLKNVSSFACSTENMCEITIIPIKPPERIDAYLPESGDEYINAINLASCCSPVLKRNIKNMIESTTNPDNPDNTIFNYMFKKEKK